MADLTLVRHGQADSAGENYDQLTPVGLEQARRIGIWLAEHNYRFGRCIHGGLKRQEQTLAAIREEYERRGDPLPAMEIHSGLAEFDLRVWSVIAGTLRHGHAEFAQLLKLWNKARHENASDKGAIFKQLTGIILAEWVRQGENFTEAESFPAFQKRVLSVMEIHNQEKRDGAILAVTSGGPISLLSGKALGLDLPSTLMLMRRIYNTSLHQFVMEQDRWYLQTFNAVPHLTAAELTLV